MPKPATKTPLDLARALLRYSRIEDPARAYMKLHDEWPPEVARILDKVLWSEIDYAGRTVEDVAAELHAMNENAAAQSRKVQEFIAKGMAAQKAVDAAMKTRKRKSKKA